MAGVWAVLLVVLAVWSAMRSPATVREQRDIDAARQTIDQVVGKLSGNVPADWDFFDDGYLDEPCKVSIVRDGVITTRTLSLTGPGGEESGLITHLASTLDDAVVRPGEGPAEGFFADAGEFVAVRGKITAPGEVIVEVRTGCRPR